MSPITKSTFLEEVHGAWVAGQLGYTGHLCILDVHRKHPASNYLQRWGAPELTWYRCWPCDVNLHAWDLIKETIRRSDFAGDLEAETLRRTGALYKEWAKVDEWETDEDLFKQGSGSWGDLRAGDSGWVPPRTVAELEEKLAGARDPERVEQVVATYARERSERSERSGGKVSDTFAVVPTNFITTEFAWAADPIYDTLWVPLYDQDGELTSIRYMNAWKKWSERGCTPPVFYGLERRHEENRIIIVEGAADTVRTAWAFEHDQHLVVIGLVSASFDADRIPLEVFKGTEVTILGDAGDAGIRATEKLAGALAKVASVSVVPLPDGYVDVCSFDGDLKALVETAAAYIPPHYLERPEVTVILDQITSGVSEPALQRILAQLPPLPTDKLNQSIICQHVGNRLKAAGFVKSIADSWIATAPRQDAAFDQVADELQGRDVRAWSEQVDGGELLGEISDLCRRFSFMQNTSAYVVLALFSVLTYGYEKFRSVPYVHLFSPMYESGKTLTLELLELLCRRAYIFIDPSASVLFRFVDEFKPTLLLDEVDNVFSGRDEDSKQLKAILNSGYTAGKFVPRVAAQPDGTYKVEMFSPYGPKVLAGIGSIPQTLRSRCIVIPMVRKLPGEEVETFDDLMRVEVEKAAAVLRSKTRRWVEDQLEANAFDIRPEFPRGLGDRMRDCWRPLFVIANAAGGDWPEQVRDAAMSLSTKVVADDGNQVLMLLEDLRDFFAAPTRTPAELEWTSTSTLILHLNALADRPWLYLPGSNGITPAKLSKLLKTATNGLAAPSPRKIEHAVLRGYEVAPIADSITRYLGPKDEA